MKTQLPTVKCLIWDLDNTLWDGTLLEDVRVAVRTETRAVVCELDRRGILQSVASKNEFDLATAKLQEMELSDFFVMPQIGWAPKSVAVRNIASRLNFAHSTIAFIDDQPAERAEVLYHLPDVRCYGADSIIGLLDRPEFIPPRVTRDSRLRREMYQASFQRDSEREAFIGPDEQFVRSLQLELSIGSASVSDLARVEELTLRTSQMNATGVHYSEEVLSQLRCSRDHEVLTATLSDKFGSYGAIGIVVLMKLDRYWRIKLLATSCRVVSFGIGSVILDWLIKRAADGGAHLVADFRRTERNRIMEVAYRFAGFSDLACNCCVDAIRDENVSLLHMVPVRVESSAPVKICAPDF